MGLVAQGPTGWDQTAAPYRASVIVVRERWADRLGCAPGSFQEDPADPVTGAGRRRNAAQGERTSAGGRLDGKHGRTDLDLSVVAPPEPRRQDRQLGLEAGQLAVEVLTHFKVSECQRPHLSISHSASRRNHRRPATMRPTGSGA